MKKRDICVRIVPHRKVRKRKKEREREDTVDKANNLFVPKEFGHKDCKG